MKNRGLVTLGTLGSIFLGVIAPLITYCVAGSNLDQSERNVIVNLLNFGISIVIVGFIISYAIVFIMPIFVPVLSFVMWVANIYYAISGFVAAKDNKPFKAITIYEFIK